MNDAKIVKSFLSRDEKRRVYIVQSGPGLFKFLEEKEDVVDDYVVMKPSYESGYFASAEDAEQEARRLVPWED
jgi:hypothetical protein